jgi:cardiolipin synthase C
MWKIYRTTHLYLVSSVASAALLASCATYPIGEPPEHVAAAAPAEDGAVTAFVKQVSNGLDERDSAYWLVASSVDALASRLALFDSAHTSLDVQYFIWQDDVTGSLLLERLLAAADRGVSVRLLVDDVSVFSQDARHAALAQHPRIEVRTFNPWRTRTRVLRGFEYAFRMGTLNYRLHNKTIVADGRLAMLGGRNIGDRYFGVYDVFVQNDLDILFAGPTVELAVENFDAFWNAPRAVPIDSYLRPHRKKMTLEELRADLDRTIAENADVLVSFPTGQTDWGAWFAARGTPQSAMGRGELIEDVPLVTEVPPTQVKQDLMALISSAQREIVISTAYLIPDEELRALFAELAARGVRIVILTNSVQSNNHMLAHVAYKRYRKELLGNGIELYELKPDGPLLDQYGVDPVEPGFMGLHSKAIVVDGHRAFVGTPNLDPRSLDLNAESGIIADSPGLAEKLRALILEAADADNAWRVMLDPEGQLEWTSAEGTLNHQPANGPGQRIMQFLYTLLPIKNQA